MAAFRGTHSDWDAMASALDEMSRPGLSAVDHLDIDKRCHEIMWNAAGNRFLLDTLDMLYAQPDRLWHLHLSYVHDMDQAVVGHKAILDALREGDADSAAADTQIRAAVTARLESPLAGGG